MQGPVFDPCSENWRLPRWLSGKESTCQCRRRKQRKFDPWMGKIPWRRKWWPIPIFLPGESHRGTWQATVHRIAKTQTRLSTHAGNRSNMPRGAAKKRKRFPHSWAPLLSVLESVASVMNGFSPCWRQTQCAQHSQFSLQCSNRWLILWVSTRWSSWLAFEAILCKKNLSLNTRITLCTVRSSHYKTQRNLWPYFTDSKSHFFFHTF